MSFRHTNSRHRCQKLYYKLLYSIIKISFFFFFRQPADILPSCFFVKSLSKMTITNFFKVASKKSSGGSGASAGKVAKEASPSSQSKTKQSLSPLSGSGGGGKTLSPGKSLSSDPVLLDDSETDDEVSPATARAPVARSAAAPNRRSIEEDDSDEEG